MVILLITSAMTCRLLTVKFIKSLFKNNPYKYAHNEHTERALLSVQSSILQELNEVSRLKTTQCSTNIFYMCVYNDYFFFHFPSLSNETSNST